jgi:outer membrane protein TolC
MPEILPALPAGRPNARGQGRGPAAALLLAAALAASPSARASVPRALPAPDMAAPSSGQALPSQKAWWMAFDDAGLNLLVGRALERERGLAKLVRGDQGEASPEADRAVVAAYLGTRVLSARGLALQALLVATERQRELLDADDAAASRSTEARAALRARQTQIVQWQQALAAQRGQLIELLAERCGHEPGELAEMLAPALSQATVPAFASKVPDKLPRGILRERPDVAQAEAAVLRSARLDGEQQLRMAQTLRAVQGWIEPQPPTRPAGAAQARQASDAEAPELDELQGLLLHAEQEVGRDLRQLADRAQVQAALASEAEARRLAYLAARGQARPGAADEWQTLEQYQQWLLAHERQAAASGELALAWLQLVASTGASAQVLWR